MSTRALPAQKKGGLHTGAAWNHLAPKRRLGLSRDLSDAQSADSARQPTHGTPHLHHDFAALPVTPAEGSRPPPIQAKLTVGRPGDKYEQEADRIADEVMRMPEPQVQRKCTACAAESQETDDDAVGTVQMKPVAERITSLAGRPVNGGGEMASQLKDGAALATQIAALRGQGKPLDPVTRGFMEARFGHDFGKVRVHTGASAVAANRMLSARAFTLGSDVMFGAAQYSPDTTVGKRLLAHELVHAVQQRSNVIARTGNSITGAATEQCPNLAQARLFIFCGTRLFIKFANGLEAVCDGRGRIVKLRVRKSAELVVPGWGEASIILNPGVYGCEILKREPPPKKEPPPWRVPRRPEPLPHQPTASTGSRG